MPFGLRGGPVVFGRVEPDEALALRLELIEFLGDGAVAFERLVPFPVPLLPVLPRLLESLPPGRAH